MIADYFFSTNITMAKDFCLMRRTDARVKRATSTLSYQYVIHAYDRERATKFFSIIRSSYGMVYLINMIDLNTESMLPIMTYSPENKHFYSQPCRQKMLSASPLFVFYVKELGLKVTNINRVLQFRRVPVMEKWLNLIIRGRKKAKADGEPTLTLAYKAVGNHGYGFGLLNLLDRD